MKWNGLEMVPLKKQSSSETAKCKRRIQKLLTEIVRIRDGGCIMRHYPETGQCSGYTAADHIITRGNAATYACLENVVCLCNRHHIYWKPQNPTLYVKFVKEYLGDKYEWIEKAETYRPKHSFGEYEWRKIEMYLKQEYNKLI